MVSNNNQTSFNFDAPAPLRIVPDEGPVCAGPLPPEPDAFLVEVISEDGVEVEALPADELEQAVDDDRFEAIMRRRQLFMLKEVLSGQVFGTLTGECYRGDYRRQRWADPNISDDMSGYYERVAGVTDEEDLCRITQRYLAEQRQAARIAAAENPSGDDTSPDGG
jgi:hypothetical protein